MALITSFSEVQIFASDFMNQNLTTLTTFLNNSELTRNVIC